MAKNRRLSLGRECAAYGCFSRDYIVKDGERVLSGLSFFTFPKDAAAKRIWCNLIKRQEGKDNFVTSNKRLCELHFDPENIHRAPGGTKKKLKEGSKPVRHAWNDFGALKNTRKPPSFRPSPRKQASFSSDQHKEDEENEQVSSMAIASKASDTSDMTKQELYQLQEKYAALQSKNEELLRENIDLHQNVKEMEVLIEGVASRKNNFVSQIITSDDTCSYYTGFPTVAVFNAVLEFLDAGPNGENIILYNYQAGKRDARGRTRALSTLDSYILTLVKLRRNFPVKHLSYLFDIADGTVSNTLITWLNFMYIRLGSICIWPSRDQVALAMPDSMKKTFPSTRCIIDCLEIKVEVPGSLHIHKMLYSEYKSHTTVKVLVGIAPGGGFTFISSAYPGSISDKNIVVKSGFLSPQLWEPGDSVMADRGFPIAEYLSPLNVKLIIPSFLNGRDQLSENEVVLSQQIARERIHVERMIQRLKCYHIFDGLIPLSLMGSLNQIISICCLLANFQKPICKASFQSTHTTTTFK